jgi:hypothetical protein
VGLDKSIIHPKPGQTNIQNLCPEIEAMGRFSQEICWLGLET